MLILIRITVWKLLAGMRRRRCKSYCTTSWWSWRYYHVPIDRLRFNFSFRNGLSTAIEGNHVGVWYISLANGALRVFIRVERGTLDMYPFVDARPTIEMTAESDNRLMCKVQADIAIKATIGVGVFRICLTGDGLPFMRKVLLQGHRSVLSICIRTNSDINKRHETKSVPKIPDPSKYILITHQPWREIEKENKVIRKSEDKKTP